MNNNRFLKILCVSLSYVLVAALATTTTLFVCINKSTKLSEIENLIDRVFVGEYDAEEMHDAAAAAMVDALGDRWSYYATAEEYEAMMENMQNAFVGIGLTVTQRQDGTGEDVLAVNEGGPAQQAGILAGDVIIKVNGESIAGMTTTEVRNRIVGPEDTEVTVTVRRGEQELDFTMQRKTIRVAAASWRMLENNIALIRIENFNERCAEETIAAIEAARAKGVVALVFDVRFNPGGYVNELVKVLDYLLPEGVVFRQTDYNGKERTHYSDAVCLEMPMAVLVNSNSYSAAEFFAACLQEYEKASVVGEQTTGKGYYQYTYRLSDGSAVNLSSGKYCTPKGVNLTEAGGVTPDVVSTVDQETAAKIYADALEPENDPQLQAAVAELLKIAG